MDIDFVRSATLFGDTVHALVDPGRDAGALVEALESGAIRVQGAEAIEPSLEDVFIHRVTEGA